MSNLRSQPGDAGISKGQVGFAGSVLALGGGATIAHLIAFGCAPIVNRLFSPEAFGAAAIFAGIVLVIGILASLRYESALMLPASDAEAANLLALSCLCVAGASALVCAAVAAWGDLLGPAFGVEALSEHKWLLPVGVFTWGVGLPLRAWAARHKRFRSLAGLSVAETSVSSGGKIWAGWAGVVGAGPLIVVGVVARAVPAVAIAAKLALGDIAFIVSHVRLREMLRLGRRYVRFPLIDTWSAALGQLATQMPFILLGASLGAAVAGHYSRAVLLAQLPFRLAGSSVRQVFFQRIAEVRAVDKSVRELVEQVFERLVWVSLLPMALIALIGPELFTVVLGSQWATAGGYARILAGWLFLEGIALPLSGLLRVLERLGVALAFSAVLVATQVTALAIGGWGLGDPYSAVLLLAIGGTAIQGVLCVLLIRLAGVSVLRAGAHMLRYLVYSLPTLVAVAAAKWWLNLPAWQIVLVALVASLSYVGLVLNHDRWAAQQLASIIERMRRKRST